MFTFAPVLEIYITNECNLTCSNCNRYNNYDFTGHYYWKDQEELLTAWSKRITSPLITLIGGEPSLHPGLTEWITGVKKLWPSSDIMVQTNGIKKVGGLTAPWLRKTKVPEHEDFWGDPTIGIGVAVHDIKFYKPFSRKFDASPQFDATEFTECAIVDKQTHFEVHDSDPDLAYGACTMKISHTLFKGLLHKCPMVAVMPEFRKQYDVRLPLRQKELLHSYMPLHPDCADEDIQRFIENRDHSIPQCNLCPATYNLQTVTFDSARKKRKKIN